MIHLSNWNAQAANMAPFMKGVNQVVEIRPAFPVVASRPVFSVETCVQIELSLVPEVEAFFIDRESDGEFRIISVVNERDATIREKVYAREEEIIAAYPSVKFDFHVLARMNRKLEDVITKAGKTVFER